MDLSRLRTGEVVAALAAIALFIIMFLPWFGAASEAEEAFRQAEEIAEQFGGPAVGVPDVETNAWESFALIDLVLLLTVLSGLTLAFLAASRAQLQLPIAASAITAGLGALSTILVLYRIIDPVDDASRKYGLFLGLLAAAGVAVGGWLAMQEEEEEPSPRRPRPDTSFDRFAEPGGTPPGGPTSTPPPSPREPGGGGPPPGP